MIGFFQNANYSRDFPVSEVRSVGPARQREGGSFHEVTMRDGREVTVTHDVAQDIVNPVIATVPAHAGWSVIMAADWRGNQREAWREPVLAWEVRQGGDVSPITVEGPWHDPMREPLPIQSPEGTVILPGCNGQYPSVDAYLEAVLPADGEGAPDATAAFEVFDAAETRLRSPVLSSIDEHDAEVDARVEALYALVEQVRALPNTWENLALRARAVCSAVDHTGIAAEVTLSELAAHVESSAGELIREILACLLGQVPA